MSFKNKIGILYRISIYAVLVMSNTVLAQETEINIEESAAVFLEEYSDDFQEHFFEGLKQKGIENYDKAIHHFLKCRRIDPESNVVTHELAKGYLLDKQYVNAQNYALEALNSQPENLWYLHTLISALQRQGSDIGSIRKKLPYDNLQLRENLCDIYNDQKNYKAALAVLQGLERTNEIQGLYAQIEESIKKQEARKKTFSYSVSNVPENRDTTMQSYKTRLNGLMRIKAYPLMNQIAKEAIEQYPLQTYFYYAQGLALNQTKNYKGAFDILEMSLDYLLDDISLSNKIYKEMANACTGLNQTSRANMYLRKIKPGF